MNAHRSLAKAAVLTAALSCAAFAAATGPARAPAGHSVTVSFAELDLTNPAGVTMLYARLQAAAEAVCAREIRHGDTLAGRTRSELRAACYEATLERAVRDVQLGALEQVHAGDS